MRPGPPLAINSFLHRLASQRSAYRASVAPTPISRVAARPAARAPATSTASPAAPRIKSPAAATAEVRRVAAKAAGADAAQVEKALERYQTFLLKAIGAQHLPPAELVGSAQPLKRLLAEVIQEKGNDALVAPTAHAFIGLADMLVRFHRSKRIDFGQEGLTALFETGVNETLHLVRALQDTPGVTSAVNAFPLLVEELSLSAGRANEASYRALLRAAREYLVASTPRPAIGQADISALLERAAVAARELPGHPVTALERATETLLLQGQTAKRAFSSRLNSARRQHPLAAREAQRSYRRFREALDAIVERQSTPSAELLQGIQSFHESALRSLQHSHFSADAWEQVSRWLANASEVPAAGELIDYGAKELPALLQAAESLPHFADQLARGGVPISGAVMDALGLQPGRHQDLSELLERVDALPPNRAALVQLAVRDELRYPDELADSLRFALGRIESHRAVEPAQLVSEVETFSRVMQELGDPELASSLARSPKVRALDDEAIGKLAWELQNVKNGGWVDPHQLGQVLDAHDGRPGLLQLYSPDQPLLRDAGEQLHTLTALHRGRGVSARFFQHQVATALELARLDRDPRQIIARVQEDQHAGLTAPKRLKAADPAKSGKLSAEAFLDAHPALPPELAFTASIQLTQQQFTWVYQAMASAKSQANVRALRDAVFAAIDMGRTDFIHALRQSPATPKDLQDTIGYVALEYRQDRVHQVPFNRLVADLKKGVNPAEALRAERVDAAMAGLGDGESSAAGAAALEEARAEVAGLTEFYSAHPHRQVLQPIIEGVVKSVRGGSWPAPKYEDPISARQLEGLTEAQKASWRHETITLPGGGALDAVPAPVDLQAAIDQLVRIRRVLPRIPLATKALPELGYNAKSAATLEALHRELVERLRDAPKGSEARRRIGPIKDRLALVVLKRALDGLKKSDAFTPEQLETLRADLVQARGAAARLGATLVRDAIRLSLRALPEAHTQPKMALGAKPGTYAADEDSLQGLICSHATGCMSATAGFNRMGLASFLADAQYKMGRVYEDGKPVGRSVWRLLKAQLPGYEGHVLWVDRPLAVTHGAYPSDAIHELHMRHAIRRAKELGVPLLTPDTDALTRLAPKAVVNGQATLGIDRGHTGLHQTETLGPRTYWTFWDGWADQQQQGGLAVAGNPDRNWHNYQVNHAVLMPGDAP